MTSIRSISCALPERELTNAELGRSNPAWDIEQIAERTGVHSRPIATSDETAFDLSVRACEAMAESSEVDFDAIDALLYCTQSPDYVLPGNAHLLHRHLGLGERVLAFDYPLACSGYVYGLAIGDSFVRSGLATEVLLVAAETYSKRTNPRDRSTTALFGDAAAVTHLSRRAGGGRVVASRLCTDGRALETFYVPAGGARTPRSEDTKREVVDRAGSARSAEDIHMDGLGVWAFVKSVVPGHLTSFLDEQSLSVRDVDLFVFHQASKMTLDCLVQALDLPPDKVYMNLGAVGNLVSASIPVALRGALDDGTIGPGDRVLLSGFGAGASYGSVLVEF